VAIGLSRRPASGRLALGSCYASPCHHWGLRPPWAPRCSGPVDLLRRHVPGSDIVAIVRTRGKVADLAARGVQVRKADYTRPETLDLALAGVNRLLLVSSSEAGRRLVHHTNAIAAAKTAGVRASSIRACSTPTASQALFRCRLSNYQRFLTSSFKRCTL
jgi:hypothetical protein